MFNLFKFLKKENTAAVIFTSKEKEVLDQLDECAANFVFPMLDNGYSYPIDTRLNLFLKNETWSIIIQAVGYDYRAGAVQNVLYTFGNCLKLKPGINNENFITLFDITPIEDETNNILVKEGIDKIMIKGKDIPIKISREQLLSRDIVPEVGDRMTIFELFRYLTVDLRGLFLSELKDLKKQLTLDIPQILQLEEWFHPDIAKNELPSKNQTFKQLAKVISTGNISDYILTHKPNTHWSNWREGGTL